MRKYPNLELLEYKAIIALGDDYKGADLQAEMFLQTWPSTALGFGGVGGSMMTPAYTTVFSDYLENVHLVFFGEKLAYIITDPTDVFFEDLVKRNMASVNGSCKYRKKRE